MLIGSQRFERCKNGKDLLCHCDENSGLVLRMSLRDGQKSSMFLCLFGRLFVMLLKLNGEVCDDGNTIKLSKF